MLIDWDIRAEIIFKEKGPSCKKKVWIPREFDFNTFQRKYQNLIKTLTVSIYPKIT